MPRRMIVALGSLILSVLLGVGVLVLLQPEWLFSTLSEQSPRVLYAIDTDKKVIALTIDDGPDAIQTPKILDALKAHGARATFFLIADRIPGNESLVHRMLEEGHEIANHMMNDEASILLEAAEFERQLLEAHRVLSGFTEVHWFRPGSGWYNDAMLSIVEKHGYQTVLGSIYPYDPQLGATWFSVRYVLLKARPGSIVVLHDFGRRGERTALALEVILPDLRQRGYHVTTLSELMSMDEGRE